MADRIVQTIAARSRLPINDPLNPFFDYSIYSGDMKDCSSAKPEIKEWCDELDINVGKYDSVFNSGERLVDVEKVGSNIIINVSLVVDGGNVTAFYTRKLRP